MDNPTSPDPLALYPGIPEAIEQEYIRLKCIESAALAVVDRIQVTHQFYRYDGIEKAIEQLKESLNYG